jgi:hypothetical protein
VCGAAFEDYSPQLGCIGIHQRPSVTEVLMATGNIAWIDYDTKISSLQSALTALSGSVAASAGARVPVSRRSAATRHRSREPTALAGYSAFELVFGSGRKTGGNDLDDELSRILAASRRGYRFVCIWRVTRASNCITRFCRCLESLHTVGKQTQDFSGFVRGGLHKLIDTTLVSVDAEWDYTVGLVDYLACACATPNVTRNRAAYQTFRRTLVTFEEAEAIASAAHSGSMRSEEKIKRLCVLGDLVLCMDMSVLRALAAAIGTEDMRAALGAAVYTVLESPPLHSSTYVLPQCLSGRDATVCLCPTKLRYTAQGGAALTRGAKSSSGSVRYRYARLTAASLQTNNDAHQGFESLSRLSNCLLRDFFFLPVIFLFLGLVQLKNKLSASGFTLVGASRDFALR